MCQPKVCNRVEENYRRENRGGWPPGTWKDELREGWGKGKSRVGMKERKKEKDECEGRDEKGWHWKSSNEIGCNLFSAVDGSFIKVVVGDVVFQLNQEDEQQNINVTHVANRLLVGFRHVVEHPLLSQGQ